MYRTFLPLTATLSARIDLNNVKKGRIYKISLFFEWCFNFIRPTYLFSKQPRQVENRRKFNFMNSIKKLKKGLINHNYTFKNTFFFSLIHMQYMYLLFIKHFVYRRYDHYNATFCRLGTNNAFSTRSPHTSSVSGLGQPQFFTINSTHSKSSSKSAKVSFDLRG